MHRAEHGDSFLASLFAGAHDTIVAFDAHGTITAVTPSVYKLLGITPDEMVGATIADFMHPDDFESALLAASQARRSASSVGNGLIRLRHRDGSWIPVDVNLGEAHAHDRNLTVAFCRFAQYQQSEAQALLRLVDDASLHDVLEPLLNLINWQQLDSHMAISWCGDYVRQQVSTGLPDTLCGVDDAEPWQSVRTSGRGVTCQNLDGLDAEHRQVAQAFGRGGYWVEPVSVIGFDEPALISVWMCGDIDPRIHDQGMHLACQYVRVALQFTAQRRALDYAATHDPLTGLANRTVLIDALDARPNKSALLYCDLDGFKPVNDLHGHATGDRVLNVIADRLRACVRVEDLLARIGGDEFVVLVNDVDEDRAEQAAQRILQSICQPIVLGDLQLDLGVSIGVVCAPILNAAMLDDADQAMYAAKSAGRGQIHWADVR